MPLAKACILLNDPVGPELKSCLREHGVLFPENYRLVVQVLLYGAARRDVVQVYAPLPAPAQ